MSTAVAWARPGMVVCALLVGATVLGQGKDAGAFTTKHTAQGAPVHWPEATVTYAIDPSIDEEVPGGVAAVTAALQSWSDVSGAPRIATTVGIGQAKPGNDGRNCVFFMKDGYAPAGAALAVTVLSYDAATGAIVDSDIVINGKYAFAALPEGARHDADTAPLSLEGGGAEDEGAAGRPVFDLAHVVAHEGGHALGLGDEPANASAVMYAYTFPGDASLRAPAADDATGLEVLYGGGGGTGGAASSGGCGGATVAPRGPSTASGALLAAAALVTVALRRRRGARRRA